MFFDPTTKPEVKADPFSLESLIAWLEKQPANKEYNYCDPHNCALCQYFRDAGLEVESITRNEIRHRDGRTTEFPVTFSWDISNSAYRGLSTFGAALERARAVAAKRKLTEMDGVAA